MIGSILEVPGFIVNLHLGCEAWEREHTQEVKVFLKLKFLEENVSESSDELKDTVCYAELAETVKMVSKKSEYKLIEKFAKDVYLKLKENLNFKVQLDIKVHKLKPPIDILTEGVFYSLGDSLR